MKTLFIKMSAIADVSKLCNMASAVDGDVTVRKGKYVIDGKSLMGLFSLDMSTGVTIEYPEDAIAFEEFVEQFKG